MKPLQPITTSTPACLVLNGCMEIHPQDEMFFKKKKCCEKFKKKGKRCKGCPGRVD